MITYNPNEGTYNLTKSHDPPSKPARMTSEPLLKVKLLASLL